MPSSSSSTPSGAKLRAFWLIALQLPLLLLGALEMGLRIVGYGDYPSLFTPIPGYEQYIQPNDQVASRYFTTIENIPSIPFDSFRSEKSDSTLRLVIQGGSTTAGFPFYFGGSFPDMLEQRLLMTFPGRQVEVINTAMAAVNSYTLLDLADEIVDQQPDAVLIYAGHNEYYGALGVGSTQLLGRNPTLIRAYLSLKPFRTVQLLQRSIQGIMGLFQSSSAEGPSGPTLMQNMVGEQRIPFESDLYQAGIDQFRSNLDLLLSHYAKEEIPVFIGTIVSNERDHAPFLSGASSVEDMQLAREQVRAALSLLATGDSLAAHRSLDETVTAFPEYAAAWYARAQLTDAMGNTGSAARDYREARLRDELRFRGPDAINDVIRDMATKHGAILVDTEAAVRRASPDGIPGSIMMLEHLHPTIQGYFVLADSFYESLSASTVGSESGYIWERTVPRNAARASLLVTPIDSLVGMYRVNQLMNSWPFKPAGSVAPPMDTLGAGTLAGQLALELYMRDITRLEALDRYQQAATRSGDARAALQSIFAIIQRYPFLPGPYLSAANVQMALRQYNEAEQYVLASLERGESPEGRRMLGSLMLNRNLPEDAIPHLERAIELAPNDAITRYNLAGAYALTNRFDEARAMASRAFELAPGNQEIQRFLHSLP